MTKFEEKLEKLPIKTIQHPFGDTEYYKAVHIKTLIAQADEEFQELKEQHGNQAESILLMLEEISTLKSQLQQQALPVVPECVGEWIECVKEKKNNALALLNDDNMPDNVNEWLFFQRNDDNINLILRAWLDGYTVEKPQLFYLKNKLTDDFLYTNSGKFSECEENSISWRLFKTKFTQQEIGSMNTGSYEQIEVTE